jgi:hypothetical protein
MRPHLLLAALLAAAPLAHAAPGHVHGEGRLDVAIDKDTITLSLELPLDAAVGFERVPKNDKEKAVLAAVQQALDAVPFAPTPAAQCALQTKEIAVPFTGGQERHDHAHEGETHHADIEARYVFRCANPAALKGIETSIFKSFKRLYRLETQRAGPSGQGAMRLTPNKPALSW